MEGVNCADMSATELVNRIGAPSYGPSDDTDVIFVIRNPPAPAPSPAPAPTCLLKSTLRFAWDKRLDLMLVKEIYMKEPYLGIKYDPENPKKWDNVADAINSILFVGHEKKVTGDGCKSRFHTLKKGWHERKERFRSVGSEISKEMTDLEVILEKILQEKADELAGSCDPQEKEKRRLEKEQMRAETMAARSLEQMQSEALHARCMEMIHETNVRQAVKMDGGSDGGGASGGGSGGGGGGGGGSGGGSGVSKAQRTTTTTTNSGQGRGRKRKQSGGNVWNMVSYLQRKGEEERALKKRELELKSEEMEIRRREVMVRERDIELEKQRMTRSYEQIQSLVQMQQTLMEKLVEKHL